MARAVKRTRYFENPIQRHRFINDELIYNKNVKAIHTGRCEESEEYYVEWKEIV